MNKRKKPLVSVIVPVFNTEEHLERCIDSLLIQNLDRIEIILINDGSTDSSGRICREYASQDERIVLLERKNEGLSVARNKGIAVATSDYIMFVDSDDYVEKDFCKIPFDIIEREKTDVVIFGYSAYRNGVKLKTPIINIDDGIINKELAMELIHGAACCYVVNKLFRKSLFNDIRFPENTFFEDVGTVYRLIDRADCIYCTNKSLYNYTAARQGSISSGSSKKKMQDFVKMWSQKKEELRQKEYNMEDYVCWEAFYFIIHFGREEGITDVLEDEIQSIKGYPKVFSTKQKLMLAVYRFSPAVFDIMCSVMHRRAVYSK